MGSAKISNRQKIKYRIRKTISGTAVKPRLSVFRSNRYIYCQLIDDVNAVTLASASAKEDGIATSGTRLEQSKKVGSLLAEKAKAANISECVFDRNGFIYHGRVKSLADGAREGGLKF